MQNKKSFLSKFLEFLFVVAVFASLIDFSFSFFKYGFYHVPLSNFAVVEFCFFFISLVAATILNSIKNQEKKIDSLAESTIKLVETNIENLKFQKNHSESQSNNSHEDFISKIFGGDLGDISGKMTIIDMNNPENSTTSDFESFEDISRLKDDILSQMINSSQNFKGKDKLKKQLDTEKEKLEKMSQEDLKKELQVAVKNDNFEWAAKLRDRIKDMEQ